MAVYLHLTELLGSMVKTRGSRPAQGSLSGASADDGAAVPRPRSTYRKNCPTCDREFTHPPAFAGHVKWCASSAAASSSAQAQPLPPSPAASMVVEETTVTAWT